MRYFSLPPRLNLSKLEALDSASDAATATGKRKSYDPLSETHLRDLGTQTRHANSPEPSNLPFTPAETATGGWRTGIIPSYSAKKVADSGCQRDTTDKFV